MHLNSYLRAPVCSEKHLNICALFIFPLFLQKPEYNVGYSINTIPGLQAIVGTICKNTACERFPLLTVIIHRIYVQINVV